MRKQRTKNDLIKQTIRELFTAGTAQAARLQLRGPSGENLGDYDRTSVQNILKRFVRRIEKAAQDRDRERARAAFRRRPLPGATVREMQ